MNAAVLQRDAFMPRPPRGMGPGLVLALLVHALLIAALAFSVNWHAGSPAEAAAELWASVPQVAAPRAVDVEPPKPVPQPVKPPPPVPRAEPEPPKAPDAQIAIEKAKREEAKLEKLREQKEKDDAAKKKKEAEQERKAEEALVEARERNIKRILGQAGATGSADAKGNALQDKAPSAGYAGRVKMKVKPNIVFDTDSIDGNPTAEVEVRAAPDGKIVSRKLTKSSGVGSYDEAVLRAIDKTEILPLDDGRMPSPLLLVFRPRD